MQQHCQVLLSITSGRLWSIASSYLYYSSARSYHYTVAGNHVISRSHANAFYLISKCFVASYIAGITVHPLSLEMLAWYI